MGIVLLGYIRKVLFTVCHAVPLRGKYIKVCQNYVCIMYFVAILGDIGCHTYDISHCKM